MEQEWKTEICPVCSLPVKDCICCPECGHVCPRDAGEPYCPACFPNPSKPSINGRQPADRLVPR